MLIQAEDIWGGTPGRVIVTSNVLPQVQLDKKPLDLSRIGPTTYETTTNPEKEDFNEKLIQAIESNGGRVYDQDEVEGLLLVDIKEKAVMTVEEPKSMKEPFLLEVIIRRLKDYRKERPVIEDNPQRAAASVGEAVAGGEAV